MATTLLPFRQVHENDVVNLFAFDGSSATRGLIVKLDTSNGWKLSDELGTTTLTSYNNTVSDRYNVKGKITTCGSGASNVPFGMLMYDVAETDENGEKLIYHPRKAHEMQVSVSGQAVPVLTKGIVLLKVDEADLNSVTINAGTEAYVGASGTVQTNPNSATNMSRIGTFLGPLDKDNSSDTYGKVLVKLDFNGSNDHL